jgi:chemotaxis protein MotA
MPGSILKFLKGWTMGGKNIIGLLICIILFCVGFAIHGNVGLYFNLAGMLIVVGGTLGATLICFRTKRINIVRRVLWSSYRTRVKEPEDIVEIIVDLSVKRRMRGILSLQEDEDETSILFLRRALGFLVDNYRGAQIKDFLKNEMYFFKIRREESERVLRTMAEICPSFGLVGSVVGLIGMLAGVGDTSIILTTLPIALTSTLYGVVLANFLFIPFAENIRESTYRELLLQKIIMEGVIAIESDVKPRILERKLKSFLTPSSRRVRLVSLKRIQEKFNINPEPAVPSLARHSSIQHPQAQPSKG